MLKNCINCHKLYDGRFGQQICQVCSNALEEQYKQVKIYIRKHPIASSVEAADACGVDMKLIQMWIEEKRIEYNKSDKNI